MRFDAIDSTHVRVAKAARLALKPAYWSALRKGVAATTEHTSVDFRNDLRTVIDVGASRGQFAVFALSRFPRARLLCFEPLGAASKVLSQVLPPQRGKAYQMALGKANAELELHVSARDDSSSSSSDK